MLITRRLARLKRFLRERRIYKPLWPSLLGVEHRPVKTILDIGSFDGDTARVFRRYFPSATIHCFEPQPHPLEKLEAWAATQRGTVICHPVALGDRNGRVKLMVNSVAKRTSSLLELKTIETRPEDISRLEINIHRLDDQIMAIPLEGHVLVKIDTEGYEKQVLQGAVNTMKRASYCIVESHADDRFVGQTPFREIVDILDGYGFRFAGNLHQSLRGNGMVSHFDALFIKEESPGHGNGLPHEHSLPVSAMENRNL